MAALPPLSLYVHIPWCVRKCPYCDFNSHALREPAVPERAYVAALLADLALEAEAVGERRIETVFFGGGTPSLFSADAIAAILAGVRARLPLAPDAEITLEANPGTVEHGRFAEYRAAGVTRISLGVQSFDDAALARLGRIHGAHEVQAALAELAAAGIENFNIDLMYALPAQTLAGARADVATACAARPAHISHYELTLEPNTLFAVRPPQDLPDDEARWAMQEECRALLAEQGYVQYEVSAWARPGRECRHNLNYWRYGDYLGLGAGAHGKLTDAAGRIVRRWKVRHPRDYLEKAGSTACIAGSRTVPPGERGFEFMLNALRLDEGFSATLFSERTGLSLEALAAPLAAAESRGLLVRTDDGWRASALGRRFLNDLQSLFLPERAAGEA
ncbi:MAG TPA: radical SAM family heme chaperone HemW [Gammaproteobacteria bacterium]|nr:radical SAM family heme chaperone HemW [Gammaproteobacteria bacterium]